ncbi:ArsR/SmtB family transcription factor [Calderihabitans maritimus]|uniref:ArsR family transcriptional regulator n=1 Tax=Calderihabitans maritimus TaxID=1246530 RepID=A0A1Z5HT88_9FIRM|nr:metalloregulator ArsR/SmtB family transcription factor [Calderihabitans maritimus]GAW92541.1 ArsR family transcriptional regulator [Calderihabitans maritimus]
MEKKTETCEAFCFDAEAVMQVKEKLLAEEEVSYMAETFKVLGDRTRINILQALMQKELCVCDLSAVLEMSPSAVSHQLRVLRNARLVKYRKEGKNVYYSIDDQHVAVLFEQVLEHVRHG